MAAAGEPMSGADWHRWGEVAMWGAGVFVLAAAIAWLSNLALLSRAERLLAIDRPNARSLHERPTPRGGGLGIALAMLVVGIIGFAFRPSEALAYLLVPLLAIGAISYLDDHRPLPAWVRLGVHLAAAAGWVWLSGALETLTLPGLQVAVGPVLGSAFAILTLVWLTNLYNFMDGMDGFAGGMGVIGFATLALLGVALGGGSSEGEGMALDDARIGLAGLSVAAAGGCAGFLLVNFPPARIFMGDVGASMLGFLAGVLILSAERAGSVPLWVGVLVFSPFIVDATVTLSRRLLRGERIWEAHHSHYYQRLVRHGWGHRRTVLVEYALMGACAVSAVLAGQLEASAQVLLAVAWGGAYVMMMVGVHGLESRSLRGEGRQ